MHSPESVGEGKIKENVEEEGAWRDFGFWQRPFAIRLQWKRAPDSGSLFQLTPVKSFSVSGQKNTQTLSQKNNCENKRATELAESQGQHQSLIKQGIMGLYGDYHYRPLHESSAKFFLSPWACARWFRADYMWPQDMRPHSLNQFFSLILFNKDWFLKHKLTWAVEDPWTYKVEYVHTEHIPLLVFMRMRVSICSVTCHDDTWEQRSGLWITLQSHLPVLAGRRRGQSRHMLGGFWPRHQSLLLLFKLLFSLPFPFLDMFSQTFAS